MRLQLDISTFFEIHVPDNNFAALLQEQVVHHPEGDMNIAFLGREFEHTAEGFLSKLRILDHEGHRVGDVEAT